LLGPWGYYFAAFAEESGRIKANVFERLAVELDSGFSKKALANHPTKWYSCQAVPLAILDGSPTNVYKTMLGPSRLRWDKENYRSDTQQTKLPARRGRRHVSTLHPWDCDRDVYYDDLIAASLQASNPSAPLGAEDDNG
jgi:hypothetical protein